MVHLVDDTRSIELQYRDRRPFGEQGQLPPARFHLPARFLQLDELLLEPLIEAAVVLGQSPVGMAQAIAGIKNAVQAVSDGDTDRVEERNQERDLGEEAVA